MWLLRLNDMRFPKIEMTDNIMLSDSYDELEGFVSEELTTPYSEDGWYKTFKKGGALEWYNPPSSMFDHIVFIGTKEGWVADAGRRYDEFVASLPNLKEIKEVYEKYRTDGKLP